MIKKFIIIVGTRPEAIKLIPVYKALKLNNRCVVHLVSTGQHEELLMPVWELFDISPDTTLNVLRPNQSLSSLTEILINQIDKLFNKTKFHCLIVQGDTTTSMVASLVGFYHGVKIAHVEAGLRTGNKYSPFPEEINRKITSVIADFHFAPTLKAVENLGKENIGGIIEVTGNTGIDSLVEVVNIIRGNLHPYESKFNALIGDYNTTVLITGHRRENIGSRFDIIFRAVRSLAHRYPSIGFIYPVHFNPNVRKQVDDILKGVSNIHLIEPVRYDEMVYLMDVSQLVMTDSGGIQEECPFLGKPVIVLRDSTERPEAIEAGCSVLSGNSENQIVDVFEKTFFNKETYEQMSQAINPYGNGKSGLKIAEILMNNFSD